MITETALHKEDNKMTVPEYLEAFRMPEKTETPMSVYAAMVQHRYWRRHKGFKGFAVRGHSKRKRR